MFTIKSDIMLTPAFKQACMYLSDLLPIKCFDGERFGGIDDLLLQLIEIDNVDRPTTGTGVIFGITIDQGKLELLRALAACCSFGNREVPAHGGVL